MDEGRVVYRALLGREKILKFMNDFYEIDPWNTTTVTVTPAEDRIRCYVTLESTAGGPIAARLLDDTLTRGLMSHWGWNKEFKKTEKLKLSDLPQWAQEAIGKEMAIRNDAERTNKWQQEGHVLQMHQGAFWFDEQIVSLVS